jgi:hypothetical protein
MEAHMKRFRLCQFVIVTLILSVSGLPRSGSAAQRHTVAPGLKGQITGITVIPARQLAGIPVAIRADGSGRCSFTLESDAFPNAGLAGAELPTVISSPLPHGGTFHFNARATGVDCTGEASTTADAAGLTRITASLGPGKSWTQVAIGVEHNTGGPCSATIDFGDGSNSATFNQQQTIQTTHVYAKPGSYRIVARGTDSGCPGEVETSINVRNPAMNFDPATAPPAITSTSPAPMMPAFPGGPSLTGFRPASKIAVFGRGFDDTIRGVLHLREKTITLNLTEVGADRLMTEIPYNLTEAVDQQATIQLISYNRGAGNRYPVQFVASRQLQELDYHRVLVTCGLGADSEFCAGFTPALLGWHFTLCCADSGVDTFAMPKLQNGWLYFKVDKTDVSRTSDIGYRPALPADWLTAKVEWNTSGLESTAEYEINVMMIGPADVSPYPAN